MQEKRLYEDEAKSMLEQMGYNESCCGNCNFFTVEGDEDGDEDEGWCKINKVWLQVDVDGRSSCLFHITTFLETEMTVSKYPSKEEKPVSCACCGEVNDGVIFLKLTVDKNEFSFCCPDCRDKWKAKNCEI